MTDPAIVALGGGHGLAATLGALRRVSTRITAVVGVADDGGSSGRLREEFGILPPGDLRMALAALCDQEAADLLQFRFPGSSPLGGHALGNLLLAGAWARAGDPVSGLALAAGLLGAAGRVLPSAAIPLTIVGEVRGSDDGIRIVRGQAEVARARGEVLRVSLEPDAPPACPEAVTAVEDADAVILGPGSWFTSVLPHLLIPNLARALVRTPARRIVVLNLDPQFDPETRGIPMARHLEILAEVRPDLPIDAVLADPDHVDDQGALERIAARLGAELRLTQLAHATRRGAHDEDLLAAALLDLVN